MGKIIAYELDPPKLINSDQLATANELSRKLDSFSEAAVKVGDYADLLLITDSVLGNPRIPSIYAASKVIERFENERGKMPKIMCTVRVCDHSLNSLTQIVAEASLLRIDALLFVRGDEPRIGNSVRPVATSGIVKQLKALVYGSLGVKFYLALSSTLNRKELENKLSAGVDGFVTQIIRAPEEVKEISAFLNMRKVELISTVLVPSDANAASASRFGFDLKKYVGDPKGFLRSVLEYSDGILLASPRSFDDGLAMLKALR